MATYDQRGQQVGTQYNADQITIQRPPQLTPDEQRRRRTMLARVQHAWVAGFLEPVLRDTALVQVELAPHLGAVRSPQLLQDEGFALPGQILAPGTSILTVFDACAQELLILGEPGAGKTILLLELVRALLTRARQDESERLPVVFRLASWATKRPPLADWLLDELASPQYDVPRKVGKAWIASGQVLPLLDGLDEVPREHRAACVAAINAFRDEYGLIPLAVCSRAANYEVLPVRLRLRGAVLVQPLTLAQIDTALVQGGEPLAGVRAAVQENAALRELLRTPLMLDILVQAYRNLPVAPLPTLEGPPTWHEHLLAAYVERMVNRTRANRPLC